MNTLSETNERNHKVRGTFPKVCLIVSTHDKWNVLKKCLLSIRKQIFHNFVCVVVSDGKEVPFEIRNKFPWVDYLINTNCPGPAGSRNLALQKYKAPFFAFFDDDVELGPDWLSELMLFFDAHPEAAICGSKLLLGDKSGRLCSAGVGMDRTGIAYDRGYGEQDLIYQVEEEVLFVSTAAFLMKSEVPEKIGLFDPTFFHGLDDSDFCWRARIAGFKIFYVPNAIAYHYLSYTVRNIDNINRRFIVIRNTLRSLIKNYEPFNILRYLPKFILIRFCEAWVRYTPKKALRLFWAEIRACAWNLFNLADTLKLRRIIQKTRIIADRDLWHLFTKRSLLRIAFLVATGKSKDLNKVSWYGGYR